MTAAVEEPSVLIVDDNKPIADTYTAFLADEYDVTTVYSGEEALEAVDSDVDVVLLDRRMPGLSGDEVLAEIDDRALDCRVVMLTAVDPEFDIVDLPFDAYMVKPVDRSQLTGVVDEMLDRARYDDDFREFLALASKKATLEREKDDWTLDESEVYAHVQDRLEEMRDEVGIETARIEDIFEGSVPDITRTEVLPGE